MARRDRGAGGATHIEPQQLAEQRVLVLTVAGCVPRTTAVPGARPQHPVGTELELATVVIGIYRMWNLEHRIGGGAGGAVGGARHVEKHDAGVAGSVRVIDVKTTVGRGLRVKRGTQQPPPTT